MLKRERYLKKIRPNYHQDLIKVITGVRRCGKSVLLRQIIDELRASGINDERIVYLNFEDFDNQVYTDPQTLHQFLKERVTTKGRYYLFFDEVQEVREFERIINSWRSTHGCSIFITGSNSKLLSGELATYLSGRTMSWQLSPFSFSEFVQWHHTGADLGQLFEEYLTWGGFAQVYQNDDFDSRATKLRDLYDQIVLKDIIQREKIKNIELLNRVAWFMLENIGNLISANSLATFLKNERLSVTVDTILNYMCYLDQAMIFSRVRRFDLKGRSVMRTMDKQYVSDLGFLQLKNSQLEINRSGRLENIVYNELRSRGSEVLVGKTKMGEIDFVVRGFGGGLEYYQVTSSLADEAVMRREFGAFAGIGDNFPKTVLSLDQGDYSHQGYRHFNLISWLLTPPSEN